MRTTVVQRQTLPCVYLGFFGLTRLEQAHSEVSVCRRILRIRSNGAPHCLDSALQMPQRAFVIAMLTGFLRFCKLLQRLTRDLVTESAHTDDSGNRLCF